MTVCDTCNRLHGPDQACPRRITNAYMMQPRALEEATDADKEWMHKHPNFSVLDIVEDAIVEAMPVSQTIPM